MLFLCNPKLLHKRCLQFLLGVEMAPRENENNANAKFWNDKQRALWYVMVFSGVVNSNLPGLRFFLYCICVIMWHSHLNDMEIAETKRFIPKGFELGTTLCL